MDRAAEWILGNAIMRNFAEESIPPTLEEAAEAMVTQLREQGFEKTPDGGDPITVAAILEVFDALKEE